MIIHFDITSLPPGTHVCTSFRDGDWAIFKCPLCPGYERRINVRTGEMRGRNGGSAVCHTGTNNGTENMAGLLNFGGSN